MRLILTPRLAHRINSIKWYLFKHPYSTNKSKILKILSVKFFVFIVQSVHYGTMEK